MQYDMTLKEVYVNLKNWTPGVVDYRLNEKERLLLVDLLETVFEHPCIWRKATHEQR